jgi:F0F1-type ATP synthase delta subunit
MSAIRLASRYAKSLFDLSLELGQVEEVFADMKQVAAVIGASRELKVMLKNPIINTRKPNLPKQKQQKISKHTSPPNLSKKWSITNKKQQGNIHNDKLI